MVSEDIITALSVYNGYCALDGGLGGNVATTTKQRGEGNGGAATVYVTHLTVVTSVATTTANSNAATGDQGVASCKFVTYIVLLLAYIL